MVKVFYVGPGYSHHADHGGYEAFTGHLGIRINSPIRNRFCAGRFGRLPIIGDIGWRIDQSITLLTPRPLYSIGILIIETSVIYHMVFNRGAIYHFLYGDSDLWLVTLFSKILGTKLVASFHDPSGSHEWLKLGKVAKCLDAIILMSNTQRPYFEGYVPSSKIHVVFHGVDTNFFRPPTVKKWSPTCITVGTKLRDFKTLASAMQLVWKIIPDLLLIAVGTRRRFDSNPHFELDDSRILYRENLTDDQLLRCYHDASVGVLPLHEATANNFLLEGMASGLPFVVSDIGGIREYTDESCSILISPWDVDKFAEAIVAILSDQVLANSLGRAARKKAINYSLEKVSSNMKWVYESVINQEDLNDNG